MRWPCHFAVVAVICTYSSVAEDVTLRLMGVSKKWCMMHGTPSGALMLRPTVQNYDATTSPCDPMSCRLPVEWIFDTMDVIGIIPPIIRILNFDQKFEILIFSFFIKRIFFFPKHFGFRCKLKTYKYVGPNLVYTLTGRLRFAQPARPAASGHRPCFF